MANLPTYDIYARFSSAAWLAQLIVKICLSVRLCVNQGGTNHNRYTW